MKKFVAIALLTLLSHSGYSQESRNIDIPYNSDNVVYSKDNIYYLNKETTPLTAIVTEYTRLEKKIYNVLEFKNGVKISVSSYHPDGWKKFTFTFHPNYKQQYKTKTYFNSDGSVNRSFNYAENGDAIK